MITMSVDGLANIRGLFNSLGTNLGGAIARGINQTAAGVISAEKEAMRRHLDRPIPFTLNAVNYLKARENHRNPAALVYVKDITADYLRTSIFGGKYEGLHPAAIKLNQYGNIPRKRGGLEAILKGKNQFVGKIKTRRGQEIYGLFQRLPYKRKPKPWKRHRPALTRPTTPIKVLVFDSVSGRVEIMPYFETAAREVDRTLGINIRLEIDKLLNQRFPNFQNA